MVASGGVSNPLPSTGGGTSTIFEGDAGVSMSGLTALVASLDSTLRANEAAYGEVDLEDLDDLLTYSLLRAQSPGGRGAASTSCVHSSIRLGMSPSQTASLCPDVLEDAATCASRVIADGFDRDSAIELCAIRGSAATAACASATVRRFGSGERSRAVAVCTDRDGEVTPACVNGALGAGFSHDQAVALCAHRGSTLTVACATASMGTAVGLSRDEAVALCADRGAKETVNCAALAVRDGFSRAQVLALCSGRGEDGNATCASEAFRTNLTRDQAVETCRRHLTGNESVSRVQGVVAP
jgi:hypothetical protein